MKSKFLALLVSALFFVGMAGVAQAIPFVDDGGGGYVDLEEYDFLVGEATQAVVADASIGSGWVDEWAWINSVLGVLGGTYPQSDYIKYDFSPTPLTVYSDKNGTVDPDSGAFALTGQPDYFLLKTGNNDTTPDDRYFLFKNNVNLDYALFHIAQETGYYIKNFTGVSHTATVGGTPVPEPATMLLFGTGLIGLASISLRKKSK